MEKQKLAIKFFRTDAGSEPVRTCLKELSKRERKVIGDDLRTMQFGWPVECRWFARWKTDYGKSTPIFPIGSRGFCLRSWRATAVLLHGFIKQSRKIPRPDLNIARKRKALLK